MTALKIYVLIVSLSLICSAANSQEANVTDRPHKFSRTELIAKNSDVSKKSAEKEYIGDFEATGKKSPALAALYSLIIPGAGHWYLDRMDVGKYFVGAEAISWTGLIALNVHGDNVRDDSRSYSVEHAQVKNPGSKDDDFFINVGAYANVYEYNNQKLALGEYYNLYDVNQNYWNWDNSENMDIYESQREKSERIYNNRIIFSSLLIANRVASAISAYLIADSSPSKKSYSFTPKVYTNLKNEFDGAGVNFIANF